MVHLDTGTPTMVDLSIECQDDSVVVTPRFSKKVQSFFLKQTNTNTIL